MLTKLRKDKKIIYGFRYNYKDPMGLWKKKEQRNEKWSRQNAIDAETIFIESIKNRDIKTKITLDGLFEEYIKQKDRDLMKLRSQYDNRKVYEKHLKPYLGPMILANIEPVHIEKWQEKLLNTTYTRGNKESGAQRDEHYDNRTLEKIQTLLNALFEYAITKKLNNFNPLRYVGFRKRRVVPKQQTMSIITPKQFNALYRVIQAQPKVTRCNPDEELVRLQHTVIFSILFWCGLRKGELMALDIRDYDFIHKELQVYKNWDYTNKIITPPKSKNGTRNVVVPKEVDEAIIQLIYHYRTLPGYETCLPLVSFYDRLAPTTLCNIKNFYFKRAGLDPIDIHDFRHSHVSYLMNTGYSDIQIAKRIGDSREEVDKTYAHLWRDKQNEMVSDMTRKPKRTLTSKNFTIKKGHLPEPVKNIHIGSEIPSIS
ncbi:MAG: tyrosine-type recombinase/integrase [Erysipelotrichaceae bacterium]